MGRLIQVDDTWYEVAFEFVTEHGWYVVGLDANDTPQLLGPHEESQV